MSWSKPQRVIKNILFYLALLSFFGAILWSSLFYIWNNHPTMVHDYDKSIPNQYSDKVTRLQTRTHKGKNPEDTFKRYQKLAKALAGVTVLHKYYKASSENQIVMIDFLSDNNKTGEAEKLAHKWQKNYPYDFNAKFKYADVLLSIDIKKAIKYYESIYTKHKDIYELNKRYVETLLNDGQFDKALAIAVFSKTQNRKKTAPSFVIYYTDESNKKFSSTTKVVVAKENYQTLGKILKAKLLMPVAGVTGLRFDLDNLGIGSRIEKLHFKITANQKSHEEFEIEPLRHLELQEDAYITTGIDPYLRIKLPEEIVGLSKPLTIEAFAQIKINKKLVLNSILEYPGFSIQCSASNNFNPDQAKPLLLAYENNHFTSEISFEKQPCQFIKITWPNIRNFSFKNLTLNINKSTMLTADNIIQLNGIAKDNVFVVNDETPSLIMKSDSLLVIEKLQINLSLGSTQ